MYMWITRSIGSQRYGVYNTRNIRNFEHIRSEMRCLQYHGIQATLNLRNYAQVRSRLLPQN
jgi:hypothetical protein